MDITDNYRRTLNALEERYIKYKRENGLYDFTDYPLYLYNTLEAYKEDITTIFDEHIEQGNPVKNLMI